MITIWVPILFTAHAYLTSDVGRSHTKS